MSGPASDIETFLAALAAIEGAWGLLDKADPAQADILEAARLGAASAQVLTRAAALLSGDTDRAHALLEQAVTLDAPPAPAQLALSRSFRARGDAVEASRWLRGAMMRARPDAALLLELAAIESDNAARIVDAALAFPCRDAITAADAARALLAFGKRKEARIAGTIAFEAGARDGDFLALYSDLLADLGLHDDPPLPPGPLGMPHWWRVATLCANGRLAAAVDRDRLVEQARLREAGPNWIAGDHLAGFLQARIAERAPFSWIRLGDGEGRFLLSARPEWRGRLPAREVDGLVRQMWHVWFGQSLDSVPADALDRLVTRFQLTIERCDLLGTVDAERLASDSAHFGFCAPLAFDAERQLSAKPDRLLTSAGFNLLLNRQSPFFGTLLSGLDFLGVIGPHPDLAARLQRYHGIERIASYLIPGETRLGAARNPDPRPHFPDVYHQLIDTLTIPRRGAVFLVAGGLLGKIYCDRIRELGGIALDIGALADAWMGHNTRGRVFDDAMQTQLPR